MIELTLYVTFFVASLLLLLPSLWAKRASSRTNFTITLYRIFVTYNAGFMIIYMGISRTGNIPLTNIESDPYVDIFSLIMALIFGFMMAWLRKPERYPESKSFFFKTPNGTRKSITVNPDRILYFLKVSILVLAGAGFYTAVFNFILSEIITLEPHQWRLVGNITYPVCVVLGIWCVRLHHRKHGRTL